VEVEGHPSTRVERKVADTRLKLTSRPEEMPGRLGGSQIQPMSGLCTHTLAMLSCLGGTLDREAKPSTERVRLGMLDSPVLFELEVVRGKVANGQKRSRNIGHLCDGPRDKEAEGARKEEGSRGRGPKACQKAEG
jgi:hypothetical protein